MQRKHDIIEIECELLKETDKAYLVDVEGEELWLPKSQVEIDNGLMQIPEWLAIKQGIA